MVLHISTGSLVGILAALAASLAVAALPRQLPLSRFQLLL